MNQGIAWLCVLLALLCSCAGQLSLRRAARLASRWRLAGGVACFLAAVACSFVAARVLGIGTVTAASALGYVIVPWAAAHYLNEPFPARRRLAAFLIVAGVVVYAL